MYDRSFALRIFILFSAATMSLTAFTESSAHRAAAQVLSQGSGTVQGSGTITGGSTFTQAKSPSEVFRDKFWAYLKKGPSGYDQWGPFPGAKPGIYEGESPHGAFLTLTANKIARQNPQTLPNGSIIVKENYGPDRKTLMAITVMYRVAGYNPDAHDWYWIKYNADGTVSRTPAEAGNAPIAGRFTSCIECHSGAGGGDYTFVND